VKHKKICTKCGKEQFLSNFSKSDKGKLVGKIRFFSWCKSCVRAWSKVYKHSELGLNKTLQYNFGISLEEFDRLLTEQNNGCAICGGLNKNGFRLAVDHNHKTGQIRGLLCNKCNSVLGYIENSEFLVSALSYLNTWKVKEN
jgi:hypothetical protein